MFTILSTIFLLHSSNKFYVLLQDIPLQITVQYLFKSDLYSKYIYLFDTFERPNAAEPCLTEPRQSFAQAHEARILEKVLGDDSERPRDQSTAPVLDSRATDEPGVDRGPHGSDVDLVDTTASPPVPMFLARLHQIIISY